tara:strand:+ start:532 stop:732 length:201 start_codon:yes stop_codon:yes gene_type:complete
MATKTKSKEKKPEKNIVSKAELKEVVIEQPKVLEREASKVGSTGGMPSTYTKKRLNSGAILESFGE